MNCPCAEPIPSSKIIHIPRYPEPNNGLEATYSMIDLIRKILYPDEEAAFTILKLALPSLDLKANNLSAKYSNGKAIYSYLYKIDLGLFLGFIGVLVFGLFHETFKVSHGAFVLAFLIGMWATHLRNRVL